MSGGKESMFSIGLSHGTGSYAGAFGDDYIDNAVSLGEIGAGAEYSMMMSDDYAWALGFDWRAGSLKAEPTTATAGNPTLKTTSTGWRVRLGGDRVGKIGDRFKWYMGPGVEYGSGKAKFEPSTPTAETEPTNRYGISGRVGGIMMINPQVGIKGQVGDSFGMASVKDTGGKNTEWYSNFEGFWGLSFAFGGK
jgi:hypothetical protein